MLNLYHHGIRKWREIGKYLLLQEYDPDLVEKSTRLVGMDVDLADPYTMLWEERVIDALLGIAEEYERDGYKLLPNIARR